MAAEDKSLDAWPLGLGLKSPPYVSRGWWAGGQALVAALELGALPGSRDPPSARHGWSGQLQQGSWSPRGQRLPWLHSLPQFPHPASPACPSLAPSLPQTLPLGLEAPAPSSRKLAILTAGAVLALAISLVGVLVGTYLGRAACSQVGRGAGVCGGWESWLGRGRLESVCDAPSSPRAPGSR